MHIQKTLLRSSPLDLWRLRYFHLFFLNGPQALGGGRTCYRRLIYRCTPHTHFDGLRVSALVTIKDFDEARECEHRGANLESRLLLCSSSKIMAVGPIPWFHELLFRGCLVRFIVPDMCPCGRARKPLDPFLTIGPQSHP